MSEYKANFRLVLMVSRTIAGNSFEEALANAQRILGRSREQILDGKVVKGQVDDFGIHLEGVYQDGVYNTE